MAVRIEPTAEPIPGYRLLERLGGGGFGEVWKAEAPGGLHKAIKFVFGDLSTIGDTDQRAEQELKALRRVASVRHPYILSLERYDVIDGQLIIVMELADRNLWDRYRECRAEEMPGIPQDELLRYMEETAEALDLMNGTYQLQHLDIKPQNVFLVQNHVKVADFGLVKDLEGMAASVTGGVTPVYAAPETFDGWVSRFCDQYSLAIVYQEVLTGERPFNGTNVRQLVLQHMQKEPNVSSLPRHQQPVIARALSKKPDDRFPSCREMVQALRQANARSSARELTLPPFPSAGKPKDPETEESLHSQQGSDNSTQRKGRARRITDRSVKRHQNPVSQATFLPSYDPRQTQSREGTEVDPTECTEPGKHTNTSGPNANPTTNMRLGKTPQTLSPEEKINRETLAPGSEWVPPPKSANSNPCITDCPGTSTSSLDEARNEQSGSYARNGGKARAEGDAPGFPCKDWVAPRTPGNTVSLRPQMEAILSAAQPAVPPAPRPEVTGDGILLPGLVVGLGQTGMQVLRRMRRHIHRFFGSVQQAEHLRLLLLDTDPEVVRDATRGPAGAALHPGEVLITPLNRPSYYLKPRDGKPNPQDWLPRQMVYRIPRSLATTGLRALGRLAFCDNYRVILRRLKTELDCCLQTPVLEQLAEKTGLGLRTNRPRIYLATSIVGGTGSGIFLDLAYTIRALLKQAGCANPEIIALLLAPSGESVSRQPLALGNGHAALRELAYFATPGTVFKARYHKQEAGIEDAEPPFGQVFVLPFPEDGNEQQQHKTLEQAGQFLFRNLCTPLGRAIDLSREELPAPPWDDRSLYCQSFQLFPVRWPRHEVEEESARQLCLRLVGRWASRDIKSVAELAGDWVQRQWVEKELGGDQFIHCLQAELLRRLGRPPERALEKLLEPLLQTDMVRQLEAAEDSAQEASESEPEPADAVMASSGTPDLKRKGGAPETLRIRDYLLRPTLLLGRSAKSEGRHRDPVQVDAVEGVLREMEALIGRCSEENNTEVVGQLQETLLDVSRTLGEKWEQKLSVMSVRLIETPRFRLAGAEAGLRHALNLVEKVLQSYEPLGRDLAERARTAWGRLQAGIRTLRREESQGPFRGEFIDLFREYAKSRYQWLVMNATTGAYLGLRGQLSDELREVNYCRLRLGALASMLEKRPEEIAVMLGPKEEHTHQHQDWIGVQLFASGGQNLRHAVEHFVDRVSADDLLKLDDQMETMIRSKFRALVEICMTSDNILKNVEIAMLATAREYVRGRLTESNQATDIITMFQNQFPTPEEQEEQIRSYLQQAEPPDLTASESARPGTSTSSLDEARNERSGAYARNEDRARAETANKTDTAEASDTTEGSDSSTDESHTSQGGWCLLVTPENPSAEIILDHAENILPADTPLHVASTFEDIVIYRETDLFPLQDLEYWKGVSRQAYQTLNATENITPHSRVDIDWSDVDPLFE